MPAYPCAELEEMVERWLEANRQGEAKKNWHHMADLYTEDATYGWNVGPNDEFMAVGREEIRADRPRARDGGARGLDLSVPKGADRRPAGRGARACGSRWPTPPGPTAPPYEIAGLGGIVVPLRRRLHMVLAARLLRRGQRRRHVHGDDQGRHAPARHAAAHGAGHVGRAVAGALPPRRRARWFVGGAAGRLTRARGNRDGKATARRSATASAVRRAQRPEARERPGQRLRPRDEDAVHARRAGRGGERSTPVKHSAARTRTPGPTASATVACCRRAARDEPALIAAANRQHLARRLNQPPTCLLASRPW